MAQWDTYRLSVVGNYDTVNTVNSFYYQELVTGNVGTGPIDALFNAFQPVYTAYLSCLNVAWEASCVTVRRLSPGITESKSYDVSDPGGIIGDGLPSTNYALMCYWASPHNSKNSNHFKFPAVSELMHQGGQFNNSAITIYDGFWSAFTDLINDNGYTFQPIRSRKPTDTILQPLPGVTRGSVQPQVRNTRGRNVYVCTG